jgi:LysM repeat protein
VDAGAVATEPAAPADTGGVEAPAPGATGDEAPAGDTTTTEETPAETPPTDGGEAAAAPEGIAHTIAAGENLYEIAEQYNISWVIVAQYNKIENPGTLTVGAIIYIPPQTAAEGGEDAAAGTDTATTETAPAGTDTSGEAAAGTETSGEAAATGDAAAGAATTTSSATGTFYTVQPGDNLFRIGLQFGISWVQIAEANGITNPNRIYAGQVLKIPVNAPGPNPQFTHEVRPGDTLFKISLRYGVNWMDIASANNLQPPYLIFPGQMLVIPGNGS